MYALILPFSDAKCKGFTLDMKIVDKDLRPSRDHVADVSDTVLYGTR